MGKCQYEGGRAHGFSLITGSFAQWWRCWCWRWRTVRGLGVHSCECDGMKSAVPLRRAALTADLCRSSLGGSVLRPAHSLGAATTKCGVRLGMLSGWTPAACSRKGGGASCANMSHHPSSNRACKEIQHESSNHESSEPIYGGMGASWGHKVRPNPTFDPISESD